MTEGVPKVEYPCTLNIIRSVKGLPCRKMALRRQVVCGRSECTVMSHTATFLSRRIPSVMYSGMDLFSVVRLQVV